MVPAVGVDRLAGELGVDVAEEELRPAAEDLADLAVADVAALVVDEAHLAARHRRALGVLAVFGGVGADAADRRRVLGRAVGAHGDDAELLGAVAHRARDRGPAEPDALDQRRVRGREARCIEEAREEVRRAASRREAGLQHRGEDAFGIPAVDDVARLAAQERAHRAADHAHRVRERCAGEERSRCADVVRADLQRLGHDRVADVHDALRIGGRARRVADRRRQHRIDRRELVERRVVDERGERLRPRGRAVADQHDVLECGELGPEPFQRAEVVGGTERRGRQVQSTTELLEDEAQLLGPVEVDDRDDRRTGHRRAVERDQRFDPVGELVGDHVTGLDAAAAQPGREPPRVAVDLVERPPVRLRVGPEPDLARPFRPRRSSKNAPSETSGQRPSAR